MNAYSPLDLLSSPLQLCGFPPSLVRDAHNLERWSRVIARRNFVIGHEVVDYGCHTINDVDLSAIVKCYIVREYKARLDLRKTAVDGLWASIGGQCTEDATDGKAGEKRDDRLRCIGRYMCDAITGTKPFCSQSCRQHRDSLPQIAPSDNAPALWTRWRRPLPLLHGKCFPVLADGDDACWRPVSWCVGHACCCVLWVQGKEAL